MKDRTLEHLLAAYGHLAMAEKLIEVYFRQSLEKLDSTMFGLRRLLDEIARCIVSVDPPDPRGDVSGTPEPQGD